MKNVKFLVFAAVLIVLSQFQATKASAQIGGVTYAYCNGVWVPGSCNGGGMGMPISFPQGISMGQPFPTTINGQRMQCSMMDRGATAILDGLGSALVAGGLARLSGSHNANRIAYGAGMVGLGYGATIGCNPMMVDDGDQPVRRVVAINGSVTTPNTTERHYCSSGKQWRRLNWEGHPQHSKFVCLPDGDTHRFEGE